MTTPPETDAKGLGACLNDPHFPARNLLARAGYLIQVQTAVRTWAGEPLAQSLSVANERNGTLIVYAESAAALTQVRYRQQELLQFLRTQLATAPARLEVKINPSNRNG